MLKAAIDESGTHGGAPILCAAACVATSRQWRLLTDEWLQIVSPLVPPGKHYHAKDKCYDKVSEELAKLIVRRMDLVCAVTVSKAEYDAVAPRKFKSVYGGNAYALAVQGLLLYIGQWCHKMGKPRVAYVLESGAKGEQFLDNMFHTALKPQLRGRFKILSHTWVGKGEAIIHPADLVAHEVFTCHEAPSTPVYDCLLRKLQVHHLSKEGILQAVEQVWQGEREAKRRTQ